ncbi:hypothetical protein PG995_007635 [Apiospora arundinis]
MIRNGELLERPNDQNWKTNLTNACRCLHDEAPASIEDQVALAASGLDPETVVDTIVDYMRQCCSSNEHPKRSMGLISHAEAGNFVEAERLDTKVITVPNTDLMDNGRSLDNIVPGLDHASQIQYHDAFVFFLVAIGASMEFHQIAVLVIVLALLLLVRVVCSCGSSARAGRLLVRVVCSCGSSAPAGRAFRVRSCRPGRHDRPGAASVACRAVILVMLVPAVLVSMPVLLVVLFVLAPHVWSP